MSVVSDRFKAAIEAIVTRITSKYDYAAAYPCTVVAQNGDKTLELKPDSPNLPGYSNVPMAIGIPGVSVTLATGGRVLLQFHNADPSRPFATVWEAGSLASITITASVSVSVNAPLIQLDNGRPVARLGDMVQVICTAPGTPAVGQIITGSSQVFAGG